MKKILFSIFAAGTLLSSCNMDEAPVGSLDDESAIQTVLDAEKFRNGIYNNIRNLTSIGTDDDMEYVTISEIAADMFIGVQNNGNRMGVVSLGNLNSSAAIVENLWAVPYEDIAAVNYFIPKVEGLMAGDIDDSTKATLIRFRGEAKWARAYYYYFLMDHFCNSYNLVNPEQEGTGIPLVTDYNPSGVSSGYPGRSSLKETVAQIKKDLEEARADLSAYEAANPSAAAANLKANAAYLSTNTVTALEARIALLTGDYSTAISKAKSLIDDSGYSLTNRDDYYAIWTDDQGSELIFVPYCNQAQSAGIGAMGSSYIAASTDAADYVAASNALAMYDQYNDVRYEWFFEPRELNVNGLNVVSPCFVKFPGNPTLNTGSNNALKNRPKPFRLSEMYLIAAEAAAESNDATTGNQMLNAIRKARIANYEDVTLGGQALINAVRDERTKELIGEGYRISDLRRWQQGFGRSIDYSSYYEYQNVPAIILQTGANVAYSIGDYRYVLPIPTGEMETNPQLAGQQNPGY